MPVIDRIESLCAQGGGKSKDPAQAAPPPTLANTELCLGTSSWSTRALSKPSCASAPSLEWSPALQSTTRRAGMLLYPCLHSQSLVTHSKGWRNPHQSALNTDSLIQDAQEINTQGGNKTHLPLCGWCLALQCGTAPGQPGAPADGNWQSSRAFHEAKPV